MKMDDNMLNQTAYLAQFRTSIKSGQVKNQGSRKPSLKSTQHYFVSAFFFPLLSAARAKGEQFTESDSKHSSKILTPGIDHRHPTPPDHVTRNRPFGPDFPGEHYAGYDKETEGDIEDGEHDGVTFVRKVEIGRHSVGFGVGHVGSIEGVEDVTPWMMEMSALDEDFSVIIGRMDKGGRRLRTPNVRQDMPVQFTNK